MNSNAFKILLVDDDDLSQRMMALLMSEWGYNFDAASNGIEAIKAVQSKSYDIVLMDLQMPLMDGFEATRKIRTWEAGTRHTPIVALTAMLFPDEIEKCLNAGMDDCISKPFSTEVLFRLIQSYVDKFQNIATQSGGKNTGTTDELVMLDIEEALPRFGKDVEIYREFLQEFIGNLPQRINQIKASFQSGDFKALSDSAHNLKGISASLGAKKLSLLSQKLDLSCQGENTTIIQEALEGIETYADVFQKQAIDILSGFVTQLEK